MRILALLFVWVLVDASRAAPCYLDGVVWRIPCKDDWQFMDRRVDPGTCVQHMHNEEMAPGDSCYPRCWDGAEFVLNKPHLPITCTPEGVLYPSPHTYICHRRGMLG